MLLQNGVTGIVFGGTDVPGFMGDPSDDLFVQFYQLGPFMPFFRAHAGIDNPNREPWIQSPRVENIIREAIRFRYQFIHYLYTLYYEASTEGLPIMRPMWQEFPQEEDQFTVESQFMFGSQVLVAAKVGDPSVVKTGGDHWKVNVNLPSSTSWYYYYNKQRQATPSPKHLVIPDNEYATFIREGTILPLLDYYPTRLSLMQAINDPVRLEIYPNSTQGAYGDMYIDDGETMAYQQDQRTLLRFAFCDGTISVMKLLPDEMRFSRAARKNIVHIEIYDVQANPKQVENVWAEARAPEQGTVSAKWKFDAGLNSLTITDFVLPVD